MKKILPFLLLSIFFAACSTSKKTAATNTKTSISTSKSDGSSYENAVVIDDKSETTGVSKEYQWLRENYPGYTFISQSLNRDKGVPYDIITIKTTTRSQKMVYFNISKFFGKF